MKPPTVSAAPAAARIALPLALCLLGCEPDRVCELRIFRTVGDTGTVELLITNVETPPAEVLDPGYIRSRRRADAPRNLVILTHGSQLDGVPAEWLFEAKTAIYKRTGLTDPDLRVLVFDWADSSFAGARRGFATGAFECSTMRPYLFMAAQAAAKLLADGGHLAADPAKQHVHLIAHSRGGALAGELARLLAEAGSPVNHLTLLDALDPMGPHADLERISDPPIRPELAGWCDNYYCDGFFYGLLDFRNYFVSGTQRRTAAVNVHFKYMTHLASHDVYIESIRDPSVPWGFQWSKLGGGYDPKRRVTRTIEVDLPRVFVDGPSREMYDLESIITFTPETKPGEPPARPYVLSRAVGPVGRFLRQGKVEVTARDRRTGEAVPLSHEVVRHKFAAGPEADTRETVPGQSFTVTLMDLGVDHIFRPKRGDAPAAAR
jgi:pimeloyl-ACP methyl ester carboxylesterase